MKLFSALQEQAANRNELPNPLPTPPEAPYEQLQRIAGSIYGVSELSKAEQTRLLSELQQAMQGQEDEEAIGDIRILMSEVHARGKDGLPPEGAPLRDRVLMALRDGPKTSSQIVHLIDASTSVVSRALGSLLRDGMVERKPAEAGDDARQRIYVLSKIATTDAALKSAVGDEES